MTSVVDDLPTPHGDGNDASSGDNPAPSPYSDEFVDEIRALLARDLSGRLFGQTAGVTTDGEAAGDEEAADDEDTSREDDAVGEDAVVTEEDLGAEPDDSAAAEDVGEGKQTGPPLIFPSRTDEPADADRSGPIHLFLPRPEPEERPAPSLTGLTVPVASDDHEPVSAPNLFVSSGAARAEVAFVPAEEEQPNRYRWILLLVGLLAIIGAVWLTWLAQSGDTVDAPITTAELVTTTEAPVSSTTTASTTASSTVASSTTTTAPSTSATSTTVATSAAPVATPRPTAPRRPATTAPPATTAAPATSEDITVPELTLPPPIAVPTTAAATTAAPPPTPPPDPPAEG